MSGAAAVGAQRVAERLAAEAERWAHVEALARYLIARDTLDGIAAKVGREDTRRIAELAGIGRHRTLEQWNDEDARAATDREQQALRHRLQWEQSPKHDPRVTELIRQNASAHEINDLIDRVREEYLRRAPVPVIGPPGLSHFVTGLEMKESTPAQTSVVARDWDEWPDHQPGYAAGFMPSPARAAEARLTPSALSGDSPTAEPAGACACGHQNHDQARFCGDCGSPLLTAAPQNRAASQPPPSLPARDPRNA